MPLIRLNALSVAAVPSRGWKTCLTVTSLQPFFAASYFAPLPKVTFLDLSMKFLRFRAKERHVALDLADDDAKFPFRGLHCFVNNHHKSFTGESAALLPAGVL